MASVRYIDTSGEFRLHESDAPGPMDPYQASCVVQRWRAHVGCLRLMQGEITRPMLRALVAELVRIGLIIVVAEREPGRRLPHFAAIEGGALDGMWQCDLRAVPTEGE